MAQFIVGNRLPKKQKTVLGNKLPKKKKTPSSFLSLVPLFCPPLSSLLAPSWHTHSPFSSFCYPLPMADKCSQPGSSFLSANNVQTEQVHLGTRVGNPMPPKTHKAGRLRKPSHKDFWRTGTSSPRKARRQATKSKDPSESMHMQDLPTLFAAMLDRGTYKSIPNRVSEQCQKKPASQTEDHAKKVQDKKANC